MHITDLCELPLFPPETIRDQRARGRTQRPITAGVVPLSTQSQTGQPTVKFPITCDILPDNDRGSIAAPIAP
jgi:hypothetical protein